MGELEDLLGDILNRALSGKDQDKDTDFFFDDEPLEDILYGSRQGGPTTANLYGPGRKFMQEVISACNQGRRDDVIAAAGRLGDEDIMISAEMCSTLAGVIGSFFPYYPNPVMSCNLGPLKKLFERLWSIALSGREAALQRKTGSLLFRWYEHHGLYAEARQVLSRLIDICRERHDRGDEAIYLNNLGFEYLLERRWEEAIPYFEEAGRIFREAGITFEEINALANYWTCRFELGDLGDRDGVESEVEKIRDYFDGTRRWYERKPLILLAKIEEQRGNMEKAIELVDKAIESAKDSNTRYPEIDGEYLDILRKIQSNQGIK